MTAQPQLVRQIGLWSGVAVLVGSTIGSGIFKSPAAVADKLPGPLPMMVAWILGGLFVLCGALTLAEVGGAFPMSGGLYIFIREAFGRLPAFLFGWAQLILIRPAGVGAVAVVFGQYALQLAGIGADKPGFTVLTAVLAIGAIIIVTVANVVGVKFGTGIQNVTTVAKVAGLIVLIVLALTLGISKTGGHFTPAAPEGSFSLSAFGLALVSALWAYDGWADSSFVAGEILNPRKNLPKVILFGTIAVIAIYLLANLSYLAVLSISEMRKSEIIAADAMSFLVGPIGITFIVATVMLSTFGTLNGSMLTAPRIFFAMANDNLFFPGLAKVHPKFQTPHVSVVLSGALGAFYVLIASAFSGSKAFGALTDAFVIGIVPFYALSVGSIFVFRAREKKPQTGELTYEPSVRTPLYPIVPALFILSTVFLLINSLLNEDSRMPTLITLGAVLAGVPIYHFAFKRNLSV